MQSVTKKWFIQRNCYKLALLKFIIYIFLIVLKSYNYEETYF